jgi:quinol monooxygenase YgiN
MKVRILIGITALALGWAYMVGAQNSTKSPAAADGKKIISAKFQIKPDKVDSFLAAFKPLIAGSRAEPGCISYTLYQDPSDRTAFLVFEEWKSQAAIDAHFATPHFKAFGEKTKDMTARAVDITIYSISSEKKAS